VAESSPYYEAFKRAGVEVIFCYQEHDEIVLGNLGKYKDKNLKSIEVYMRICVCVYIYAGSSDAVQPCMHIQAHTIS